MRCNCILQSSAIMTCPVSRKEERGISLCAHNVGRDGLSVLDILLPVQEKSENGAQKMLRPIAWYRFDNVSFQFLWSEMCE